MTAPDCSSLVVPGDRAGDRTTAQVGLEWPRKPDYLALIAARDWGLAASRGISLELGEPKACLTDLPHSFAATVTSF